MDIGNAVVNGRDLSNPSLLVSLVDDAVRGIHNVSTADQNDAKLTKGALQLMQALGTVAGLPWEGPMETVKAAAGLAGEPIEQPAAQASAGASGRVVPVRPVPARPVPARAAPARAARR